MRTARLSIAIFAAQIALALPALAFPALASAQVQAASYAVFGMVADQDGHGIADAEVGVLDHDRVGHRVRSDTAGHFELNGLTNASARLRVRHMGFAPRDVAVEIPGSGRRTGVVVTLDPMAAELDGMTVNDTLKDPDDRLRAFNERRATNDFAHFIDGDAIAHRRPQYISEMLRTIPGVSVSPSRLGYNVRVRGCAPLVWVDGVRIPGVQLDDVARPADIAGLEIYSSFAGIPAQYFDRSATCGTILVWTRAR